VSLHTENSVLLLQKKQLTRFMRRESRTSRVVIGCALSVVFCLTIPVVLQKSAPSTDKRLHAGNVLKSALPDETRNGEDLSLGTGVFPVVHALLHARTGERVGAPQVTPIPSVLYMRPATDRAPPLS
jgi:hypothetical protein